MTALRASLKAEEARRRRTASEAADQRTRAARLQGQMTTATSAAQLTALEHEVAFAAAAATRAEDEELVSMEQTETLEGEFALATTAFDRATTLFTTQQQSAERLRREHTEQIAGIEAERRTLRAQINDAPLSQYDRVAKSRGTGIAEALDGGCTACRMKLRPQRWNDLTSREHEDELFSCESCGRLLFYDPRRNSPGSFAAGDRLQAARKIVPSGGGQ